MMHKSPYARPRKTIVSRLTRFAASSGMAVLVLASLSGAFWIGRSAGQKKIDPAATVADVRAGRGRDSSPSKSGAPIIYFRHPDGQPQYRLRPHETADGRDFIPVDASEDLNVMPANLGDAKDAAKPGEGASSPRILYYRNPMGLPDTSPAPKKDSMGMDYLPVYAGEVDEGGLIKVSPGKAQRSGVRSEPVERRLVAGPLRAPGSVQLDERLVSIVATRSEAFIDKVSDVTTGDQVRQGQPLMQLYSPEINAAAAQLISNPGAEGSRRRLLNLNVPNDVISEIERTRKAPASITWSAPRDGVVLERKAIEGMRAAAGDVLFRIADVSRVWVLVDVPESALAAIRVGQAASVQVKSLAGRSFIGRVMLIYPQVSKETRTVRVRIELPNEDRLLLPDMYAEVEIATGQTAPVIAVPDESILDKGTSQIVLIDKGDGRFETRDIKTGQRGNGFTEVLSGLVEGDKVVVSSNFLIDAESNLKAALQAMAPTSPGEPMK